MKSKLCKGQTSIVKISVQLRKTDCGGRGISHPRCWRGLIIYYIVTYVSGFLSVNGELTDKADITEKSMFSRIVRCWKGAEDASAGVVSSAAIVR